MLKLDQLNLNQKILNFNQLLQNSGEMWVKGSANNWLFERKVYQEELSFIACIKLIREPERALYELKHHTKIPKMTYMIPGH